MTYQALLDNIKQKKSFLCVGLDSDITKIPQHLLKFDDPVFEFNRQIIDATQGYAVAYKPNLAFYECNGTKGWRSLEKTIEYLRTNYSDLFLIADAKRGDIGNTSKMYAKAFFETLNFDAVTVAPYMGEDSVTPFLSYLDKWVILLALTSNKGAFDFQFFADKNEKPLFEKVLEKSSQWGNKNNMMFVVGATKTEYLQQVRKIIPNHFLLVPGIGAQGGSLEEVVKNGINNNCGLLVNSSRDIIFAASNESFAAVAGDKAFAIQQEMKNLLEKYLK